MMRPQKGGADGEGDVIHEEVIGSAPVETGAEGIGEEDRQELLPGPEYGIGLFGSGQSGGTGMAFTGGDG